MKIDWVTRFRNKAWIAAFISILVPFVYQTLGLFGIIPPISQEDIIKWAGEILNLLAIVGVVMNPLTPGITDKE